MRSHSDGVIPSIESHELRLEHDIAIDLQIRVDSLKSTKASRLRIINRREVDI
jgi:hypothetical protein